MAGGSGLARCVTAFRPKNGRCRIPVCAGCPCAQGIPASRSADLRARRQLIKAMVSGSERSRHEGLAVPLPAQAQGAPGSVEAVAADVEVGAG